MKYKFVVACLLGVAYHVQPSQQVSLQQSQLNKQSIDKSKVKKQIPKGSLLHKLMQEMRDDFAFNKDKGEQELAEGDDKESPAKSKADKREELRRKLFGYPDESKEKAGNEDADQPSPVVASNPKLDVPKKSIKSEEEPKKAPEKHEKTKIKINKRTHRPVDYEETSHDMFRGDEKEKNQDKMSEFDKQAVDSDKQGNQNGHREHSKTGTVNAPYVGHKKKLPGSSLPVKPFSTAPRHLDADEYQKSKLNAPSASGVCLINVTMDSENVADKFVKRLFSEGLIAQAERTTNFERSYMSLGTMDTSDSKAYLQLTTRDALVTKVIDFINQHNQNQYDYPVPDVTVEPVTQANPQWVAFVKKSTKQGAGFKYDDKEEGEEADDTNVDIEKDMREELAAAESDTTNVLEAINEAKKSIEGKKALGPEAEDNDPTVKQEAEQEAKKLAKSVSLNEAELVQAEQMATDLDPSMKNNLSQDQKDELKKEEKKKVVKEQIEDYNSLDLDDEVPNSEPGKK